MQNEIVHIYPAGSLQQGFIYHAISQPDDDAYRLQLLYDYHHTLDVEKYLLAWEYCIAEYPILRTAFNWEEEIIQIVYKFGKLRYELHDVSALYSQQEKDAAIQSIQAADRKQGFDLTEPTLMRLHIIKQASDYYTILKSQHHSISDGWSGPLLFNSLSNYYKALLENRKVEVKEDIAYLKAQEYIHRHKQEAQQYWSDKLRMYDKANDINPLLDIPVNAASYNRVQQPGSSTIHIGGHLYDSIRMLIRQEGITLNALLQFVWHKLLQVYSSTDYSIVGTTVSGRDLPVIGIGESVGLYINTLPLVIDWSQEHTIRTQLQQIQRKISEMNSNSFADLVKLQKGGERLFHTLFIYENYPASINNESYSEVSIRDNIETNNYPLSLMAFELDGRITMKLQYDGTHLSNTSADHHLCVLKLILEQVVSLPERKHSELCLLTKDEFSEIVYERNQRGDNAFNNNTIIDLFEEVVSRSPSAIGLVYEDKMLSYSQLNEKSNQLARFIRKQYELRTGQQPTADSCIALYTSRSEEMILAILAVLKTGAAYVPLDPAFPQERINYILNDTQAGLILCYSEENHDYYQSLPEHRVLCLRRSKELYTKEDVSNLAISIAKTALAYIIYTSGTTGKPKGVMVEHAHVTSFVSSNNFIDYSRVNTVAGVSNYAFDGSIFDIFFSLLNGKKLVLINDKKLFDLQEFDAQLTSLNVDTFFITTALFNSLVQNKSRSFEVVKQVLFGGEACNIEIVRKFLRIYPEVSLIHVYGPTENIVFSTYCNLTQFNTNNTAPIGKRLADKCLYVLDQSMVPVPVNVTGELYIGGEGVSRGYLNFPDQTAQSFRNNPYLLSGSQNKGNIKLYKTGDLVRWLPDANLEFIGRNDQQIKVRGFRIELGEIEAALSGISGIRECCVTAKERITDGIPVKHIIGYYIKEENSRASDSDNILGQYTEILPAYMIAEEPPLTPEEIMEKLKEQLPAYMLPVVLVEMQFFPLTTNGKIDKRALPDPDFNHKEENYIAPSNEAEMEVCKIWQDVLGLKRVGITDDFFLLGGDSILSIRIVSKMEQIGYRISVSDVLRFRDIQTIFQNLSTIVSETGNEYKAFSLVSEEDKNNIIFENNLIAQDLEDIYPASYLQSGMLIESGIKSDNAVYNDVLTFVIKKKFNPIAFESAWQKLIDCNEQMRTAFVESDKGFVNVIYKYISASSKIHYSGLCEEPEQLIAAESRVGFDFSNPGLFRIFVQAQDNSDEFNLYLSIHHAIADGWSVASLISTFVDIYVHGKELNKDGTPPFAKVVAEELDALNSSHFKRFWQDYLDDYELKSGNMRDSNQGLTLTDDVILHSTLQPDLNTKLTQLARVLKISPDIVFLGAYNLALSVYHNTKDLVIGTVVNNRLEAEGGDKVFGLHLNTIPIRFKKASDGAENVSSYLQKVFQGKLKVNEHRKYPYGKMKFDLNLRNDIYTCAFNYVHFHIAEENYDNQSLDSGIAATKTNIPLTLNIIKYREEYGMKLEGHADFIGLQTATGFLDAVNYFLEQFVEKPQRLLTELQVLRQGQLTRVVEDYNDTIKYYPESKTVVTLFNEQVEKTPDNIALIYKDTRLTYKELDEKSNQLARFIRNQFRRLKQKELPKDTLVPIYTDRGSEMIVGILGILKSGAAYVPIDTSSPATRIRFILEETAADIMLSQEHLAIRDKDFLPGEKLILIDLKSALYKEESKEALTEYSTTADLSYVIFTSGTTGKPKGVMVEHRAFAQFIYNFNDYLNEELQLKERDVLSLTNYVFDIFGLEYALPITTGGKIIISSVDTVTSYEISSSTIVQQTPGTLLQLATNHGDKLSHIVCLVGGESLAANIADVLVRTFNKVVNVYGPAETVIWSTAFQINEAAKPLIGKPLSNEQIYILDHNNWPVPLGVTGELFIGGAGLGRGYLNNPLLTRERFVEMPLPRAETGLKTVRRVYKTGDLARWTTDGNIEFVGRNDDQVKVNGYRIELGEIENALSGIPGISRCCVITKFRPMVNNNSKYLIAYYTKEDGVINLTSSTLSGLLYQILPAYMVPSVFIELERFPMNRNGKVDKFLLPDPETGIHETEYTAPENRLEEELCNIWQDVIGIKPIGTTNDFFKIGGNSILAIQTAFRMSKALKREVRIADIFRFSTIRQLLNFVSRTQESDQELIKPLGQDYRKGLPDMIMIHPANAGTEMYMQLASLLTGFYNCIGIENYNIHNAEKISDLNPIGQYYLSALRSKYTLNTPLIFLGWSLGGKIALEMAAILESSGYTDLHVILLDTFISDGFMHELGIADEGDEESKRELRMLLNENMYEAEYIEKVLSAWDAETKLGDAPLSAHLIHTKVTLFKATRIDEKQLKNGNTDVLYEHFKTLKANNINKVASKLTVINLDCTHRNILDTCYQTIGNHLIQKVKLFCSTDNESLMHNLG